MKHKMCHFSISVFKQSKKTKKKKKQEMLRGVETGTKLFWKNT